MAGLIVSPLKLKTSTGGLYGFFSFTFTSAGLTGATGPTLAQCLSSYNTTTYPWLTDTSFFNVSTTGTQSWTCPIDGLYKIECWGAQGYSGGGGGFYGGGGGSYYAGGTDGGGGGGSGYIGGVLAGSSGMLNGVRTGDGQVIITKL